MEVKRCACGCGKILVNPTNAQKFYDAKHRRRFYYSGERGISVTETTKRKKMSPEQRWRELSWEELTAELARIHKTYGQVQSMYYNGTLPEEFGNTL